jgi:DNA-binding transcriptional regulator GbsR (MarR family)
MTDNAAANAGRFIEEIAILLEADGLPRVAGRMFGLLLMSEGERSLDDLAEQLEVSKASVSTNARLLEHRGMVERVGMQGDRRDFYRIVDNVLERSLEQRVEKIRRFQQVIGSARSQCGPKHTVVRERLDNMEAAYQRMLELVTRALDEWRNTHTKRTPTPARSR